MTSLYETIKNNTLEIRKTGTTVEKNLMVTLLSEINKIGKDARNGLPTEEEVIKVLKSFLKNVDFTLSNCNENNRPEEYTKALQEKTMLESYLPKQLSEEDLTKIFTELRAENPDLNALKKTAMAFLKKTYPGQYDGKMANSVLTKMIE